MYKPAQDIRVLYEDNHVLVAVKPGGVLSQADGTGGADMLTQLKAYIREKYHKPGRVYLGLVHRLDRPVSGVMVFARTSKSAARLSAQIREREMEREYLAVVAANPTSAAGTLRGYIAQDPASGLTTVSHTAGQGQEARLQYRVLRWDSQRGEALLHIRLGTGRKHQIRAQLAGAGWPIVGDRRYGGPARDDGELALFACRLGLRHPVRGEYLQFAASPPPLAVWMPFADIWREAVPGWLRGREYDETQE